MESISLYLQFSRSPMLARLLILFPYSMRVARFWRVTISLILRGSINIYPWRHDQPLCDGHPCLTCDYCPRKATIRAVNIGTHQLAFTSHPKVNSYSFLCTVFTFLKNLRYDVSGRAYWCGNAGDVTKMQSKTRPSV